jgi:hypothetical protein
MKPEYQIDCNVMYRVCNLWLLLLLLLLQGA